MANYEEIEGIEENVAEEEAEADTELALVSEPEAPVYDYPEENNRNLLKAGIGIAVAGGIATALALKFHPVKKLKAKIAARKEEKENRAADLAAAKVLEALEAQRELESCEAEEEPVDEPEEN